MVIYQLYIDDSGSDTESTYFVLAGFISTYEKWTLFSYEWKEALELTPRLDYFKMNEAEHLTQQFSRKNGWNKIFRDKRLEVLTDIITKYTIARVSVSIKHSDFNEYIRSIPTPKRKFGTDHPYGLLFLELYLLLLKSPSIGITEPCDLILDEQGSYGREAALEWSYCCKDVIQTSYLPQSMKLVGSPPIFCDDKTFIPLQAADLYAWHVRRRLCKTSYLWMPQSAVMREITRLPCLESQLDSTRLTRLRNSHLNSANRFAQQNSSVPMLSFEKDKRKRKASYRATKQVAKTKAVKSPFDFC